jgi:hypothetical protein
LRFGSVIEAKKEAICAFDTGDDRTRLISFELTDQEIAAYRSHPDTFFASYDERSGRQMKDAIDLYDWFFKCYSGATTATIANMSGYPNIEDLKKLPREDILKIFRGSPAFCNSTRNLQNFDTFLSQTFPMPTFDASLWPLQRELEPDERTLIRPQITDKTNYGGYHKGFCLEYSSARDAPLLLGDHPVAIDNLAGGKLGINVPGAVIYFPLSPQFALGLHCESLVNEIHKATGRFLKLPREAFLRNRELYVAYNAVVETMECFVKGIPAKLAPENVENINSIQILEAERFVFSCDGNFELVKDMIRADSRVKNGPPGMTTTNPCPASTAALRRIGPVT